MLSDNLLEHISELVSLQIHHSLNLPAVNLPQIATLGHISLQYFLCLWIVWVQVYYNVFTKSSIIDYCWTIIIDLRYYYYIQQISFCFFYCVLNMLIQWNNLFKCNCQTQVGQLSRCRSGYNCLVLVCRKLPHPFAYNYRIPVWSLSAYNRIIRSFCYIWFSFILHA